MAVVSAMTTSTSQQPPPGLTPLREDLQLLPGPNLAGGSPTWSLHDPVRNKFYRLGRMEFEVLCRWPQHIGNNVSAEQIAMSVNQETTLDISEIEVAAISRFFMAHCLLRPGTQESGTVILSRQNTKKNFFIWLIHNYLFFRVPLIRPGAFLDATLPLAKLLVSKPIQWIFCLAALCALILVSRQWQSFIHTFTYFFSLQGLIYYMTALTMVKIFHELGHAYTARHYGVKVPSIGVAMIVLWPMLYSDTTESWKLKERKTRMKIVAAGLGVELALAVIATLLWTFAADGPFKSICFIVATATWITSLFLNLSPFMRFDGYYLFSDYLDIPNLQDRAFALAKWLMRKTVLGTHSPCPEMLPSATRRLLIIYAYATWIYRLLIFTTIALMVYHMFFKVLGMLLFAIEITFFILLPIIRELQSWWMLCTETGFCNRNIFMSITLLFLAAGAFFLPWNSTINTSALLISANRYQIYVPTPGQISQIYSRHGDFVQQGDLLLKLDDPLLDLQEDLARKKIATLENQLKRQIINSELFHSREIIKGEIVQALTEIAGYEKERKLLEISSPTSGQLVDFDENLRVGQWVNDRQRLGLVISQKTIIEGYLNESTLSQVKLGDQAKFYADNRNTSSIKATVVSITPTSRKTLTDPYLASVYGGELAVSQVKGKLLNQNSLYKMQLQVDEITAPPTQVIRGHLALKGRAMSIFERLKKRVMAVLIRESGF